MRSLSRRDALASLAALPAFAQKEGWTPLCDGKSLDGWTASENTESGFEVQIN